MNSPMIINLIKRDFNAYRNRILGVSLLSLLIGMFMIFVNTNLDRMFAGSSSVIFAIILIAFIPELQNRSVWMQTASLPVTRRAMVVARFLSSVLIVSLNLLVWVGTYGALMVVLDADPQFGLSSSTVLLVWMNLLFSMALFYLVYFRLSFMWAMGVYLLLMILPQVVQTIMNKEYNIYIEDIDQPLSVSVVTLSLFIICFLSSMSYFARRDL